MYHCPTCQKPAISGFRKWWSNVAHAECPACHRLCHVPSSSANGIFALAFVLLVLTGAATLATKSVFVGVGGIFAAVAIYAVLWARSDLIPISRERAALERNLGIAAVILSALASIFS